MILSQNGINKFVYFLRKELYLQVLVAFFPAVLYLVGLLILGSFLLIGVDVREEIS